MKTYIKHRIVNVVDIKRIHASEFLDFEGKYKDYVEAHDFWELCYVESGEVTLAIPECTIKLSAGEVAFVRPNCKHAYDSACGNESRVFVLCFDCLSQCIKPLGGMRFKLLDLQSCMQCIVEECQNTFYMNKDELLDVVANPNFGGQQAAILQLEYMLIRLVRTLSAQDESELVFLNGEHFYGELADVITEYFEAHIAEKLSLDVICNKVNYSRSFVCKIFKEQTGETLFSCFNRLKVEAAKKMLRDGRLSVADVAQKLGFSESKHFGALFKKYMGMTPGAYKKQENKREERRI